MAGPLGPAFAWFYVNDEQERELVRQASLWRAVVVHLNVCYAPKAVMTNAMA